jgi:hypothetical protein
MAKAANTLVSAQKHVKRLLATYLVQVEVALTYMVIVS